MMEHKLTIQQKEQAIIQPQIKRIHREQQEFGSFWWDHKTGVCVILTAILLVISLIPYLGPTP